MVRSESLIGTADVLRDLALSLVVQSLRHGIAVVPALHFNIDDLRDFALNLIANNPLQPFDLTVRCPEFQPGMLQETPLFAVC